MDIVTEYHGQEMVWKDLYECATCGDIFENEEDARRCCGEGERPIRRYHRLTPLAPDAAGSEQAELFEQNAAQLKHGCYKA